MNELHKIEPKYSKAELEKNSTGSTFKAINKDTLSSLKLIVPSNTFIKENSKKLNLILDSIEKQNVRILSSKSLQKSLIHQIF